MLQPRPPPSVRPHLPLGHLLLALAPLHLHPPLARSALAVLLLPQPLGGSSAPPPPPRLLLEGLVQPRPKKLGFPSAQHLPQPLQLLHSGLLRPLHLVPPPLEPPHSVLPPQQ